MKNILFDRSINKIFHNSNTMDDSFEEPILTGKEKYDVCCEEKPNQIIINKTYLDGDFKSNDFTGTKFDKTNMFVKIIASNIFNDTTFENVNLYNNTFESNYFNGSNFTDCTFDNSNFSYDYFENCIFERCYFENCIIKNVSFKNTIFKAVSFANAVYNNVDLTLCDFEGVIFYGTMFTETNFKYVNTSNACFDQACFGIGNVIEEFYCDGMVFNSTIVNYIRNNHPVIIDGASGLFVPNEVITNQIKRPIERRNIPIPKHIPISQLKNNMKKMKKKIKLKKQISEESEKITIDYNKLNLCQDEEIQKFKKLPVQELLEIFMEICLIKNDEIINILEFMNNLKIFCNKNKRIIVPSQSEIINFISSKYNYDFNTENLIGYSIKKI